MLQFFDRITIGNSAKLIEPSRRTPTAALNSVFESSIERRAIDSRLSARNNFQNP